MRHGNKGKLVLLLVAMLALSCRHYPDPSGSDARDIMASTVKVSVTVIGVVTEKIGDNVITTETVLEWSGTGVVVAEDMSKGAGESLVASAAHVTNVAPIEGDGVSFVPVASITVIEKLDGSRCRAEQIYADVERDIGVLRTFCRAGDVAKVADRLPQIGSIVTVAGAGLGFHPNGSFFVTDGRFVGFLDGKDPKIVATTPIVSGHSGAGLFHNGELIGIVSMRYTRFENSAICVPLSNIKVAIDKAMVEWNAE